MDLLLQLLNNKSKCQINHYNLKKYVKKNLKKYVKKNLSKFKQKFVLKFLETYSIASCNSNNVQNTLI